MTDLPNVNHEQLSELSYLILVGILLLGAIITLLIKSYFSDRKLRYTTSNINEFIKNQSTINAQISSAIMMLSRDRICECTYGQVKVVSHNIIDAYLLDVITGTVDAVSKNQLNKRTIVERRVDTMIDNAMKVSMSYLDSFIYAGRPLTAMVNQERWECLTKTIVMDSIYSGDDYLFYLHREILSLKDTLRNDYYETLKTRTDGATPIFSQASN